jgi:thiol:disulfide interchange protein DsbD
MKNEQEPTNTSTANTGKACSTRACCPLQSRWGMLIWVLLLGAIVYMQWPMLKGMYYKTRGAEAPVSAVAWRTGLDAALAESAASGKPVLVDFTAAWCPPCQVMKHEVWPDPKVASAANERYIPLLVDVDDPANAGLAEKYGIGGIPTLLVLDEKGKVLRVGGFMSAGEMLKFLESNT